MTHPIRFLWTVPRTVSTSFERMVSERGDHTVFDEPFSRAYYFGPDRRSERYEETIPESSTAELVAMIDGAAQERPVFVKDMAYHAQDLLHAGYLGGVESSFLIRHPAAALRSLARTWPDFTDDETGWGPLGQAADVVESVGQDLVVMEADALCRDPAGVVGAWCDRVGLERDDDALTWEPGMRPEWELWSEWHASSARSTGFGDPRPVPLPPGPEDPRLLEAYEAAMPVYERLAAVAIG